MPSVGVGLPKTDISIHMYSGTDTNYQMQNTSTTKMLDIRLDSKVVISSANEDKQVVSAFLP